MVSGNQLTRDGTVKDLDIEKCQVNQLNKLLYCTGMDETNHGCRLKEDIVKCG